MHDTASLTGEAFLRLYGAQFGPGRRILDVGSRDVNGTLRPYAGNDVEYVGVDVEPGPGVDVVLEDPYQLPFPDASFDLVLSTSCLEHDPLFWLTFDEMARVARIGGFLYMSAPVQGEVHRHPVDCWRFYPDAGIALVVWAGHCGHPLRLVESFQLPPLADQWVDYVAVFERCRAVGEVRISDLFPRAKERLPVPIDFKEANRRLGGREPTRAHALVAHLRVVSSRQDQHGSASETQAVEIASR
jgi:SAM-dependent methyltransferase